MYLSLQDFWQIKSLITNRYKSFVYFVALRARIVLLNFSVGQCWRQHHPLKAVLLRTSCINQCPYLLCCEMYSLYRIRIGAPFIFTAVAWSVIALLMVNLYT